MVVIVAGPLIVAVHLNGNAPVDEIERPPIVGATGEIVYIVDRRHGLQVQVPVSKSDSSSNALRGLRGIPPWFVLV